MSIFQKAFFRNTWRVVIAIAVIVGVIINTLEPIALSAVFSYYTIQSNILCLITALWLIAREAGHSRLPDSKYATIKVGAVMAILLTGLVFHFMLSSALFAEPHSPRFYLGNALVHYVVPIMMFLDYLLFDKKGLLSRTSPFWWVIVPYAYCLYVFIYSGLCGGRFVGGAKVPYFFLDYEKYGYSGVLLWILLISAFYIALSYVLVALDYFLGRKKLGKR